MASAISGVIPASRTVCAASRNTLLVGSRCTTLGIYNLATNFRRAVPEAVTLPQFFMRHGWRAEGMGKIFHIGHGNVGDEASWSVPFIKDNVVDYALPASTDGGKLTREAALFAREEGRWVYTGQLGGPGKTVRRETPKVGRNDPCPCGSGKKFKQCHGKD